MFVLRRFMIQKYSTLPTKFLPKTISNLDRKYSETTARFNQFVKLSLSLWQFSPAVFNAKIQLLPPLPPPLFFSSTARSISGGNRESFATEVFLLDYKSLRIQLYSPFVTINHTVSVVWRSLCQNGICFLAKLLYVLSYLLSRVLFMVIIGFFQRHLSLQSSL